MKKLSGMNVVLVRSPQPYLLADDGRLFSPNRLMTPEPTLPMLHGILQDAGQKSGLETRVTQLDLRDFRKGGLVHHHYGDLELPYVDSTLRKIVSGVPLVKYFDQIEDADVVGFTNNFTMSRNVVLDNIKKVRQRFPEKEIWIGGRDVFPEYVLDLYVEAAGGKNVVVFEGHVFGSLPEYVRFKAGEEAEPFGIVTFDENGMKKTSPTIPLTSLAKEKEFSAPLPIYPDPEILELFNTSGEGPIDDGRGKFAYMTISVGCPHDCGYCTTGFRERFSVRRTMSDIKSELKYYQKLGVKTLGIMDDNILVMKPEVVRDIMGLVNSFGFEIEYGNGLELKSLLRNWDIFHEGVLRNCTTLYAPLEDLTQDSFYRKLDSMDQQVELLSKIRDFFDQREGSRYVTMGVILGVPGHTKEGLQYTLPRNAERFLEIFTNSNVKTGITAFNFMPLAGTPFGEEAFRSGRMLVDQFREHPEVINFETVSYQPEGLTAREVYDAYINTINMNPAGRLDPEGKDLGVMYEQLKRFGQRASSSIVIPNQWSEPGKELTEGRIAGAGLHYKAPMTERIAEENRQLLGTK